jgi:hypothetical protein
MPAPDPLISEITPFAPPPPSRYSLIVMILDCYKAEKRIQAMLKIVSERDGGIAAAKPWWKL